MSSNIYKWIVPYITPGRPVIEVADTDVRVGRALLPRAKPSAHRCGVSSVVLFTEAGVASRAFLVPLVHTRYTNPPVFPRRPSSVFALTRLHACMMERIAMSVALNEAVLLVGETGAGTPLAKIRLF